MREIKFRGERIDNGEFVYGDLVKNSWGCFIIGHFSIVNNVIQSVIQHEVKPESVGQFTGYDKLYEGDIVEAYRRDDHERKNLQTGKVTFLNGCFMLFNCTTHEFFRIWQSNYKILEIKNDGNNQENTKRPGNA